MKAIKGVKFGYRSTPQTLDLLSAFREMVNDAIRICLAEHIRGRLNLRKRLYKEIQEKYCIVSCYAYSVAEIAWSIVKRHKRWHRKPYARRLTFKMDATNSRSTIRYFPSPSGRE